MARVMKFAIATAMRQEEIFRVTWSDFNKRTKMLTIRDRKDPRQKKAMIRKFRFSPFRATMRWRWLKNRRSSVKRGMTEYSRTTTNQLERILRERAKPSKLRTCIFMICATKGPAVCLKPAWQFSKWR